MVKTTKKLLNFLQLLNKYVQKETKKRNLFIRRWLSFGKKWKPQRGRKATAPLHTPRAFFRSSWVVVCDTVLTFVCMLRYWMWNVVPRGLQWNCNEVLDVRCTSAEFCSPCGVQQGAAAYAAYTAEVPQPMRHIQPEFRNLCGIYGGVSAIYIMQQYILQKYTKFR